jgi:hypothetical protein
MNRKRMERIEMLLHRLDSAVVVRDPGSARSVEAFDGLRKQVIQSGTNHRAHIAHLLSLSDTLNRGGNLDLIRDRVNDFLAEVGVMRTSDISLPELFEVEGGTGQGLECVEPAVVERLDDGRLSLIRYGKARRIEIPEPVQDEDIVDTIVVISDDDNAELSNRPSWIWAFVPAGTLVIGLVVGLVL